MTSAQVQHNTHLIFDRYSGSTAAIFCVIAGGREVDDLPYLEIACGSEAGTSDKPQSPFKEGGAQLEGDDSLEKQGSLIALAWSKRTEQETVETERDAMIQPEAQAAAEPCDAVSFSAELKQMYWLHV